MESDSAAGERGALVTIRWFWTENVPEHSPVNGGRGLGLHCVMVWALANKLAKTKRSSAFRDFRVRLGVHPAISLLKFLRYFFSEVRIIIHYLHPKWMRRERERKSALVLWGQIPISTSVLFMKASWLLIYSICTHFCLIRKPIYLLTIGLDLAPKKCRTWLN